MVCQDLRTQECLDAATAAARLLIERRSARRLAHEIERPLSCPVEGGFVESASIQCPFDLLVGVPAASGHLKIEPRNKTCLSIVDRAPVRDHEAAEAPLAAQNIGQQPLALRCSSYNVILGSL